MRLWVAVVLLILSVAGILCSARGLRHKKVLRITCMTCCILMAIALAGYIGLTAILLDAARNKPPAP